MMMRLIFNQEIAISFPSKTGGFATDSIDFPGKTSGLIEGN